MLSDAEIVKVVINGDRAAFAELVRRYERTVRSVAADVLGDIHSAEDAAQDAFVKAYEKLPNLRSPKTFGPWLLKITRREALNYIRRKPKSEYSADLSEIPAHQRNGRLDEESKLLLSAVMKLPPHEHHTIILRYFDNMSVKNIAEITGRSVGTITKQLSRAHARLRKQLKELEP